jgi:ankyrin repeat protein
MLSWGALLGGCTQDGWTPLLTACGKGHVEAVKLLLARSDVAVNHANQVRGRGGAGRERGQGGWAGVHTTMLRRRVAHLTVSVRVVCGAMEGGHRAAVWQAVGGWVSDRVAVLGYGC